MLVGLMMLYSSKMNSLLVDKIDNLYINDDNNILRYILVGRYHFLV